jgi:hypothetical protein
MYHDRRAELALALRGLLGQDVPAERLHTLECTGSGAREALGRTSTSFDLRHFRLRYDGFLGGDAGNA